MQYRNVISYLFFDNQFNIASDLGFAVKFKFLVIYIFVHSINEGIEDVFRLMDHTYCSTCNFHF